MSESTAPTETAPEITPTDLLDNLRDLGKALPVNFQPNAHDAGALTAGIIWYLATGSLVPPKVDTPDEAAAKAELADTTALNAEKARVAELERQLAAAGAKPSPVAPAPVAPVAEAPAPTPPVEESGGQSGALAAATAINADVPSEAELSEAFKKQQAEQAAQAPVGEPPAGS